MMKKIKNAEEAMQNETYLNTLKELIYQLADDDFILAYRNSEWLGLAPHIEEDLAFSSISQNTMGHAFMYYQLLEELGEGDKDALAHGRTASERKNAIILEEVNGTGTYLKDAKFDWAFAVVRNFFYDIYKKIKLEALKTSSYEPLAHAAVNISKEQYYHLLHWNTWFKQLVLAGGEARTRIEAAIQKVWDDFEGVLTFGHLGDKMEEHQLIAGESVIRIQCLQQINDIFNTLGVEKPGEPKMIRGNGRNGEHTEDLSQAISTLSEVYNLYDSAAW